MKFFFKLDDIPHHSFAAKTSGGGKTVFGERIIFKYTIYGADGRRPREDKKIGSIEHCHAEEHVAYNIAGGRKFRLGDKWYDLNPGDVTVTHAYTMHGGNSDKLVNRYLPFIKLSLGGREIY